MGKRREGREAAVQFLFQCDLCGPPEPAENFWKLRPATQKIRSFSTELVEGVLAHLDEINERIKKYVANYDLKRIGAVERAILRVAIYEMLYCDEVPPVVSINEAIEIAKRFGAEDSGRFVNGVLDRVKLDLDRPARVARAQTESQKP
jgi:N utilization substance protein B